MSGSDIENPKVSSYRDLVVWQKGIELATLMYELTKTFPADEKFGLISWVDAVLR